MKTLVAIILTIALIAGSAFALSLPGTESGYVNITASAQTASVIVEIAYTRTFTVLPTLHVAVNRASKVGVLPVEILSESLTGFTVRICPKPGQAAKLTWTATQKTYQLY
jgi:hypothetical protein